MNTLKEYDVLRLIEHNQICYVSSDNRRGCPLAKWMKYHPYISKDRMLRWIDQISNQLMQIHKCRGNPGYQYVSPYTMIVLEEGEISFLDVNADSNQEMIRAAGRKNIKEHFLPIGNEHWTVEELELYGFGKTIQYLLNFTEVVPTFSKAEERVLRKMISGCIHENPKKRFHKISDVRKSIIKLRQK